MREQTLAIIKPDAVKKNAIGSIISMYEKVGLYPQAMHMRTLTQQEAEGFYAVHKARPFFGSLTTFMASGPILVLVLAGDNAIKKHRDLMGATDPAKAEAGTIRAAHGTILSLMPCMALILQKRRYLKSAIFFQGSIWLSGNFT